MLRSIILIISLVVGSTAFANTTDIGDLFTPTEGDHSLYIIGKIFGNVDQNVLPGEASASGPELLGNVFRVFNIVTLGAGVLMVIYTLVLAVLQTAHHGKMMGDKMSSMWVPVRIAFAIAMLIPKSNGYCIAQVLVMWLVVQGVGAADSIWSTALDYFEDGGSIGDSYQNDNEDGSSDLSSALNEVYKPTFMGAMLTAATCVEAHNKNSPLQPKYFIQKYEHDKQFYVYFGSDINNIDPMAGGDQLGYECGRMPVANWSHLGEHAEDAGRLQMEIIYTYAQNLRNVATKIVTDDIDLPATPSSNSQDFVDLRNAAVNYVTDMGSNERYFTNSPDDFNEALETLRQGGWILAGNYYQVLSTLEDSSTFNVNSTNTPNMLNVETPQERADHSVELNESGVVYTAYDTWDHNWDTPVDQTPAQVSREQVDNAFAGADFLNEIGVSTTSAEHMEGFINMLSGDKGSTDPVLRAAQYGQGLMKTTANVMISLSIILPVAGSIWGICTATLPGDTIWTGMLASSLPIAYGLLGFLYLQGAALGIYLPMVPFIIFVIGGIGWVFAVVESMIAAPLVALGMTLPEGHEIYGRAEPAYMILINLFLRPSLMILGFLAAILVAWLAIDLVNISVLSALQFGGIVPDQWFGHHVVSFMYVGIVISVITKVFGLINLVPDRVLRWIGDNTTGSFADAQESLSGARSGAQDMAKQAGDTAGSVGRSGTELGTAVGKGIHDKYMADGKNTTPAPQNNQNNNNQNNNNNNP